MGNRAVITTKAKEIGVYLHWNGGRDSIEPILQYCKAKGYVPPEHNHYGWAALCQVINNWLGYGGCGIDLYENTDHDNWDNGTYVIEDWEIVERLYQKRPEQNEYDFDEVQHVIDSQMPDEQKLWRDDESVKQDS